MQNQNNIPTPPSIEMKYPFNNIWPNTNNNHVPNILLNNNNNLNNNLKNNIIPNSNSNGFINNIGIPNTDVMNLAKQVNNNGK
jgi:hypothetical protein